MGDNTTVNRRPPSRINSVDTVKGIAIVLMVFGHTVQGALHRQLWDSRPAMVRGLNFSEYFIYSFHMAAFFFVSGLFIAGSVARRGALGFALEKIRTLLYPYILWGVAFALLNPLTARFRMSAHAFSWRSFFWDLSSGNSSWFLITLFVCQLLALVPGSASVLAANDDRPGGVLFRSRIRRCGPLPAVSLPSFRDCRIVVLRIPDAAAGKNAGKIRVDRFRVAACLATGDDRRLGPGDEMEQGTHRPGGNTHASSDESSHSRKRNR